MFGGFRSPYGSDGVQNPGTNAIKNAGYLGQHSTQVQQLLEGELTAKHPVRILSRTLKSSTDNGPNAGESDCLDTSIFVAEPAA